ncbi:MAG: xylulokinase [Actinobacteria bacterium]|nr:xylulokinase [Actinomycetota bacterium]
MQLVAGIDTSTQSVKVVIRDAQSGQVIREGRAAHPDGSEVDPALWWTATQAAIEMAGGLDDVSAIAVAGQQHGMVALDKAGKVIRPALLWNDTRSAAEAEELNLEMGGGSGIASAVGSALVASFTASKVRWLAKNEKENAARVAIVALPHDWISWKISGSTDIGDVFTDRGDASGTGYFDSVKNEYRKDIFAKAIGSDQEVKFPRIVEPRTFATKTKSGIPIAAGTGDNAAAAIGVGAEPGDVVVSLGTSGTAFAVSTTPTHDASGEVAGFADGTGYFLPLVCTLNAARILDAATRILGVTHDELGELALKAKAGANGLTLLPYFEGERTPNRPDATGVFSGMNLANSNREDLARAMIEGMLCGMADAVASLEKLGVEIKRILLVGGAAKNPAVGKIASALFGREVLVPPPGEYVAIGAAKLAAWALLGSERPPQWNLGEVTSIKEVPTPEVLVKYRKLRDQTQGW